MQKGSFSYQLNRRILKPRRIQSLLKTQVNPTEIKVGITSIKLLRDDRIIIEAGSKNEIEKLRNRLEKKAEKSWRSKSKGCVTQD